MLFRGGSEKPWFPWAGSKGYAFRTNNLLATSSPLQIAWPCRDDAQKREGRLSIDLLMLSVPRGQRPALNTRGKMVSQMAANHLCRLQPSPAFLPSAFDSLQESHYELISSLRGASWWKTLLKLCFSVLNLFKADCWEVIIISVIKIGNNANNNNFFFNWTLKPQTFFEQVWWVPCPGLSTEGVSKKLTALSLSQQMRIGNPADC